MKKLLTLVLALCLMASVLPAAVAEGAPYVSAEPVTLTAFLMMDTNLQDYIKDWNETPFFQNLEKLTGVHIEFTAPPASAAAETLNLLTLGDELPDIIFSSNIYSGGPYQGYVDGYFADLAPYLPEYAPEYWSIISGSDDIWRETVDSDGVIAGMYRILQEPNPAFMRLILKKEVLDKLGVTEVPALISDWENLFQKMLDAGMTPYALDASGYEEKFMGAYDVMKDFYQVDGKIKYGQVQEGFKQYLTLMNDWYSKGYISKDFVSMTGHDTLFATDTLGTFNKPIVAAYNFGKNEGYTVLSTPYARVTENQPLHWDHYTNTMVKKDQNFGNISVSADCENIELAVKWINFLYTAPGVEAANWGVKGLNFDYDENGKPYYLPAMWDYNGISAEGLNYYFKGHNFATYAYGDTTCHANLLKSPEAAAIRDEFGDDPYLDSAYYIPTLSLTEEETDIKADIMNDINTYVNEMVLKFIIGTEPLTNWDTFVSTVEGMGLQKVIDVQQAALDRYLTVVAPAK